MTSYLCRSRSLPGIPLQQVYHQMDGLRTGVWNQCLQIVGDTLRPAEIHCTRKLISFRPVILAGEDEFNTHLIFMEIIFIHTF